MSYMKSKEYYEKYTKPMELPKGKTCGDCEHFERTCKWLISCKPDRITCDWNPSRFIPIKTVHSDGFGGTN